MSRNNDKMKAGQVCVLQWSSSASKWPKNTNQCSFRKTLTKYYLVDGRHNMAAPDLFLQRVLRLSASEKHEGGVDTGRHILAPKWSSCS